MKKPSFIIVACLMFGVNAATRVTWVGGSSGDLQVAANWFPAHAPSSPSTTAYVAVFTNSVNLTASSYWYPAGVEVSKNATVTLNDSRVYPTSADIGGEYVFDVEEGSSLVFNGTIFYGSPELILLKKGGGLLKTTGWFGNVNSGKEFGCVDVKGGTLYAASANESFNCASNVIVRAGGTFKTSNDLGLNQSLKPVVHVEEGGLIDMGGKKLVVSSATGAGVVSNGALTITCERNAGSVFAGLISGTVNFKPVAGSTPAAASWVIGARDTLKAAALIVSDVSGCDAMLLFKEGIHEFDVKSYPADKVFYDRAGEAVRLQTVGRSWFVNSMRPDDTGDGSTTNSAYRTLAAAMQNPNLSEGDTVYALPGVYDEGQMGYDGKATSNRVLIAKNVRLVSTEGPEKTFIVGRESSEPGEGKYGCGPGALRCVALRQGSVLQGFTLTGGRTAYQNGGGVSSAVDRMDGLVENCVISNCAAGRGGGANYAFCSRTRFVGNQAYETGSAMHYGKAYNCVFDKHTTGTYVTLYASEVVNCSFLSGNTVKAVRYQEGEYTADTVRNSLLLCPSDDKPCYRQSVFLKTGSGVADANIGQGSIRLSVSECLLTEQGALQAASPLRDIGDNSLRGADALFDYWLDVFGGSRICNGTIDIGSSEYDTRGELAASFGRLGRMTVSDVQATPSVQVAKPRGFLMSGSFQEMSALLGSKTTHSDAYKFTASVAGTGFLEVVYDGAVLGSVHESVSPTSFKLDVDPEPRAIVFRWNGTGTAIVSGLSTDGGLVLVVR